MGNVVCKNISKSGNNVTYNVTISGLAFGEYKLNVTANVDGNHSGSNKTIEITVEKANSNITNALIDPDLNISASSVTVGENVVIKVTTNTTFTGNVTVTIKGTIQIPSFNVLVEKGVGTYSSALPADTYTLSAVFSETSVFKNSTKNTTVNVNKKNINLNVTVDGTVYEGEYFNVTVTTDKAFTGNVTVTVNKEEYTVNIKNGVGTKTLTPIKETGNYTLTAVFAGNANYTSNTKTFTVKIVKKEPVKYDLNLTVNVSDITLGENINIIITTNNTFTGNVTVKFNGNDYNVTVTNGTGNITTLKPTIAGKFDVTVTFNGDDTFNYTTKTANAYARADTVLTVTAANTDYSKPIKITVKNSGNPYNGNIIVEINGIQKTVTVTNGVGSIQLTTTEYKKVGTGKHSLTVLSPQSETAKQIQHNPTCSKSTILFNCL